MNSCDILQKYQGTKSQKIMEMINEKLKDEAGKDLPKLKADKELAEIYEKYVKIKKECDDIRHQLDKRKEELGIEWLSYDKKYRVSHRCRIPCIVKKQLQRAENYASLGDKKHATQIWEMIIDKYKLF